MKRSLYSAVTLTILAMVCSLPAAIAQTGPSGPSAAPAGALAQAGRMTPDRLVNLLRSDGYLAELKKTVDGGHIVSAVGTREGWKLAIEFEFNAAGANMNVICPLGNPTSLVVEDSEPSPRSGFEWVNVGGQKVMKPDSEVNKKLNCFRLMGLRQGRSNGHRTVLVEFLKSRAEFVRLWRFFMVQSGS
jgi:hypothetical protein